MADVTDTRDVLVPDIGDFADVPVIEILVSEGDEVAPEDPLVVLESEKATMEVPAPAAGVVDRIAVAVGDTVSEGDLILTLRGGGADGEDADDAGGGEDAPAGTAGPGEATDQARAADGDEDGAAADDEDAEEEARATRDGPVYAGPGARRLARELGVPLEEVTGTGRKGRITKDDVRARAAAGAAGGRAAAPAAAPAAGGRPELPPWPSVDHAKYGPVDTVPLSRIKRIAGPNLARNWALIPHVTQHDEADITDLEAFRKEVNAARAEEGVKLTMVSLVLKALVPVLRAFPEFNASLEGEELVLKRYYHLGFAVDTPGGLVVPVIRDVDRKGLLEIARELAELSTAAREGGLDAEQMRGGTFTVSSLGGIGGTAFTPIINAPEVAILGVSRSAMAPRWDGERFVPRLMLPLSLSYDHRVIDGAAAARFTARLAQVLSDPREMLL